MILIADSGSTKTDWRIISNSGDISQVTTKGLNPVYKSKSEIGSIIENELITQIPNYGDVKEIFFYGAGCMKFENKHVIVDVFNLIFPQSKIEVASDMLAAARSCCYNDQGIVAILGTGANICDFDGNKVIQTRSGLGFILGDEGSGSHIGKTFIKSYLNKELPNDLSARFEKKYKLSKSAIISAIYREPNPNLFLAKFSKYVFQLKDEPFIMDLIIECFNTFFEKHVVQFPNYKNKTLHIVGSVGFYYSDFIRRIAADKNIRIGKIVEKPISGLALYHEQIS